VPATHLHTLATAAAESDTGGPPGWLILAGALLVWGIGYRISIRLHPFRPCRACGITGRHRGAVFTRSFRACRRCGGSGRQLRWFAKDPRNP
jgi:hypothetical protein